MEIFRFCAEEKLHVIVDEVYAMSVFNAENEEEKGQKEEEEEEEVEEEEAKKMMVPDAEIKSNRKFISALAFGKNLLPDPERTHFVWSLSKDFALSGFRMGLVHSYKYKK